MAAIQTLGSITQLEQPNWNLGLRHNSVRLYDSFNYDYAALYRMQPNVRVCVDFLARNIAQLGLHTFRRVSETDRVRLRDHPLPQLLARPLPAEMKVTRYRLIEGLISDLGIYFNAYWLKMRTEGVVTGLLRVPPIFMTPFGGLAPTRYELDIAGLHKEFEPSEVVHFRGYNPEDAVGGLSPLETLRRTLAEEDAAGQHREQFWGNAARIEGFIKRPKDAPEWSDAARTRFLAEFNALYSGAGVGAGGTAVLEEGMEWQAGSFSPEQSEYLGGRKLTREECARSYHIPLPMVGILDHATFSNISEQHKNLYQDSLGPWLVMVEQDIELQLLPEFEDTEGVYTEFNIAEKMAGSFEDQVKALQSAVGRPWMTANEARARMNMPSLDGDADELVTPLNVVVGGQASPADSAPADDTAPKGRGAKRFDSAAPRLREKHQGQWARVLTRHYRRQEAAIVSRVPKARPAAGEKVNVGGVWFDEDRWNQELAADLFGLNHLTALAWAKQMQEQAGIEVEDEDAFEAIMLPWLQEHSRVQAEGINTNVRDELAKALADPDPAAAVRNMFEVAATAWAIAQAISAVTAAANFGSHEAADAGGLKHKTWRVNSGNPRPSHKAMDGMTIGIREKFPTGQRWPGDPAGGAEENSNCECSIEFS